MPSAFFTNKNDCFPVKNYFTHDSAEKSIPEDHNKRTHSHGAICSLHMLSTTKIFVYIWILCILFLFVFVMADIINAYGFGFEINFYILMLNRWIMVLQIPAKDNRDTKTSLIFSASSIILFRLIMLKKKMALIADINKITNILGILGN